MEPTDEEIVTWINSIQVEPVIGAGQTMTFKVSIPRPEWLPEGIDLPEMSQGECTSDMEQATWAEQPELHEEVKKHVRFEAAETMISTLEEKFG